MVSGNSSHIKKLILGTAQFGLDYGISNSRGQIPKSEVSAILTEAAKAGITTLDTAAAYGTSEQSIGEALQAIHHDFKIISKYPPNTLEKSLSQTLEQTLQRLGVANIYGYMLHSYSSYSSNPKILHELEEVKATGKVQMIGMSLYHPHEAVELLNKGAAIDMVQVPYSVFDQRFKEVLPQLRGAGIETHVRSVYLQGLYFMQPSGLSDHFRSVASKVQRLQQLAADHDLKLGALLLGFALSNQHISNVVLGVESLQTLQENILYCNTTISDDLLHELQGFNETNENIILPYKWPAS